jgi:hypothetical protein
MHTSKLLKKLILVALLCTTPIAQAGWFSDWVWQPLSRACECLNEQSKVTKIFVGLGTGVLAAVAGLVGIKLWTSEKKKKKEGTTETMYNRKDISMYLYCPKSETEELAQEVTWNNFDVIKLYIPDITNSKQEKAGLHLFGNLLKQIYLPVKKSVEESPKLLDVGPIIQFLLKPHEHIDQSTENIDQKNKKGRVVSLVGPHYGAVCRVPLPDFYPTVVSRELQGLALKNLNTDAEGKKAFFGIYDNIIKPLANPKKTKVKYCGFLPKEPIVGTAIIRRLSMIKY